MIKDCESTVVDVSGSMGLESAKNKAGRFPIDIAREELWRAIRSMAADGDERGDSTFNVVLFAQDALVYEPGKMVPVTKRSKEAVKRWIDAKEDEEYRGCRQRYEGVAWDHPEGPWTDVSRCRPPRRWNGAVQEMNICSIE